MHRFWQLWPKISWFSAQNRVSIIWCAQLLVVVCMLSQNIDISKIVILSLSLSHHHYCIGSEALNRCNYSITFQTLLLKSRQFWLLSPLNVQERREKPADVAPCVKYTILNEMCVLFAEGATEEDERKKRKKFKERKSKNPIKNVAKISVSTFPVLVVQSTAFVFTFVRRLIHVYRCFTVNYYRNSVMTVNMALIPSRR